MSINIDIYEFPNKKQITMYTAEWCNPCKKIKPLVLEYLEKNKAVHLSTSQIEKADYKLTVHGFVPYFVIGNVGFQTSNMNALTLWIEDNVDGVEF